MKIYYGKIGVTGEAIVQVEDVDTAKVKDLDPRNDLANHSPDGFSWGYSGSGPTQLALALCADVLGDDIAAKQMYQEFKFAFVANLGPGPWAASDGFLRAAIQHLHRNRVVTS